ncbi:CDP-alcohol phosphatidyltransferase family protein [Catellatospora sp. KI3]|uniref:CDP-alcohol phosphatidyltransferase family protein n=1 Tax=Catellatospora sp. KI3 TaxID=3041620 RepID=UPI0024824B42|nr:CDP-alcohol phosphatidyltransferase family protein [Catellatospora sp. KI3]MDI1462226.1 CDP-alcohol phosphatidyltransferase family protein [Catellatospora sp. KI3]
MPPQVIPGPLAGLLGQSVLLAVLEAGVGLGAAGWTFGLAYALALCVLLGRAMRHTGTVALGPADTVTLSRAVLVGGVTALTAESLARPVPVAPLLVLTVVALVLDAVDGLVARRTGTGSAFGARFDMETDAWLIAVLSVYAAPVYGAWVLCIGAMRYAYVAVSWVQPWLRGQLFPRYWRKVVAAVQGIVLAVAAADVLPRPLVLLALLAALALLTESFGRDVIWLWQRRPATGLPRAPAAARARR